MARSEALAVQAGEATLAGTLLLPDQPPDDGEGATRTSCCWRPGCRVTATAPGTASATPRWFASGRRRRARPAGAPGRGARRAGRGQPARRPPRLRRFGGRLGIDALFTKIDDARDMLAAIRGHPQLDLRRTGIVGHGEGAGIALSVAIGDPAVCGADPDRSFRALLARRPAPRRGRARVATGTDRQHPVVAALDRWSEEIIERARAPRGALRPAASRRRHRRRWPWPAIEQAIHTPPLALATMLHRSVTLVHGAADAWADPDESVLLAARP